jgi:hypothetical protein
MFPSEIQEILRKNRKSSNSEYGDFWQKERQRLQQLNPETNDAGTTKGSKEDFDINHTQKGAVFIPITWLRKRKTEYYSGTDPEWQGFVALSKDVKQVKEVKARLANLVCEDLSNMSAVTQLTGKPLTVYAAWLDFNYPSSAPVEYERSGIIWMDNKVGWITRRVDERQAKRLYKVLRPTALLSSLQGVGSRLLTFHYGKLQSLWSPPEKQGNLNAPNKPVTNSGSPVVGQEGPKSTSTLSTKKGPTTSQQNLSLVTRPSNQPDFIRNIMPTPEPKSVISVAAKEFKTNFLKKWRTPELYIPRGACFLAGEVGVMGPDGRCKMRVVAVYLPKEKTFVQIEGKATGIWLSKQAPVGKRTAENPPKS